MKNMADTDLSEMEIKLLNATRKFIRGTGCSVEIYRANDSENSSLIGIHYPNKKNNYAFVVHYEDKAESGGIEIYEKGNDTRVNDYKSFLVKEVPEIKERVLN